ncbi:hypothetical protein [Pectobacterium phage PPWS1]|uniref:Uncharacterized protein n=1 Tax=Pectobacterium phage PPWS1 TaxID=1685500 RepID=A0A0P0UW17_9CAUD|nr:hypothetical protein HOR09_gp01 [Pectobacterium phage PPWS1]BAS69516.1 hypothetical protein [Pectobacterium phage PPWS1]
MGNKVKSKQLTTGCLPLILGVQMKIDFSKFTIAEIEAWVQGTSGMPVDADNSELLLWGI